ncbi:hypothetical protein NPIL_45591 [Nephila pilipes]|uniref:Uncharacterized protein n=1 Tax=Nephila pilipes TaxID=299642 RepID=A0A8X6TQA4_NEPPI|nr:hypothetical protein NPIL_45591 [Nephila pilipes]
MEFTFPAIKGSPSLEENRLRHFFAEERLLVFTRLTFSSPSKSILFFLLISVRNLKFCSLRSSLRMGPHPLSREDGANKPFREEKDLERGREESALPSPLYLVMPKKTSYYHIT